MNHYPAFVKTELSFGERLKEAKRKAADEQIATIIATKTKKRGAEDKVNPMDKPGYRGPYQIKRPAVRVSSDEAIARETRQQKREADLQAMLKERRELREKKLEDKKLQRQIAADRLKEVKKERREPKLPEYIVGLPDANGKIPVKVLDHQNTKLLVKPGADIEAVIKKFFFRPENDIKPLAYYSPVAE